jgi:hypothetical protein
MASIMSSFLNRTLLVAVLLALLTGIAAGQASDSNVPLTNASIVKLVRAGFKEKTIISIVSARPPAFDLSPDRMIELKRGGVSERIILAMLFRQEGMALNDDTWTDDPFFDPNNKQKEKQKSGAGTGKDDSADIFGSSGSSRGSTQSRGGNSSASGDTETTGSATVRIIRPPAEDGATPKLEKISSLTNDSIVELVEAGFSEGTIIRRIENSPVEFNLSPAKLADLRKHRVSDKILNAMKAAMGDDSKTGTTGPISNGTPKPK